MTNIILVEDEGLVAQDLKRRLEQAGYNVPLIADTAVGALLGVEHLRPQLVLMDIRLRGPQDGIETADQIRRRFQVPVMYVTAHADKETLERARITEPFGYIVKPFHNVDFRAQIEMALWKHQMEQKLRISEAWLSATFRNVADALIATDRDGNIAFMNTQAATLTGWDWREAKAKPLLEVFRAFEESTGLPAVHPIDALYDGREVTTEPRTFELKPRGDRNPVHVEAELSANRDDESLLGIIVVFRDISERRRAEKQNLRLQKMNSLALMAIGLGRELAESQAVIDQTLQQLIARSKGSSLHMLGDVYQRSAEQQSIIQQLIALGKAETRPATAVDLNMVLNELEPKFIRALGSRRTMTMYLQPGIPLIQADQQDLRESLVRLVVNARQALPDGGDVEISTRSIKLVNSNFGVQLSVRDSGKGIRASAKERVFDPYFQSRAGGKNPGFSLALVYQFVALSGGFIDVENAPGGGVAYLLSFPSADLAVAASA
jgi:PAS domain S-box-containing protein